MFWNKASVKVHPSVCLCWSLNHLIHTVSGTHEVQLIVSCSQPTLISPRLASGDMCHSFFICKCARVNLCLGCVALSVSTDNERDASCKKSACLPFLWTRPNYACALQRTITGISTGQWCLHLSVSATKTNPHLTALGFVWCPSHTHSDNRGDKGDERNECDFKYM